MTQEINKLLIDKSGLLLQRVSGQYSIHDRALHEPGRAAYLF